MPAASDLPFADLGSPTALAFTPAPDPHVIAVRQTGQTDVYDLSGNLVVEAMNISSEICSDFERGLLGVAVDFPNFVSNRYVYVFANFGGCSSIH